MDYATNMIASVSCFAGQEQPWEVNFGCFSQAMYVKQHGAFRQVYLSLPSGWRNVSPIMYPFPCAAYEYYIRTTINLALYDLAMLVDLSCYLVQPR